MILDGIQDAVRILAEGGLVAFPTETVYGLGADALDADAVARVFAAKGRPSNNPLIVHVSSLEMAGSIAGDWPEVADALARAFWPGPLTLAVPRGPCVPDIVTAGGPTVAIRMPDHPVTLALIRAFAGPIVGPSANASGSVSPTAAEHVQSSLGPHVPVLDGGPCLRGIESTVVRIEPGGVRVLRQGVIGRDEIAGIARVIADRTDPTDESASLPSPGMLGRHYAPRTPVRTVAAAEVARELARHPAAALLSIAPTNRPLTIPMPADAGSYARRLYAALHEADAMDAGLILVERPEGIGPIWDAVRDRLARASASE